jgi:hypothetical protein
MSKLQSYFFHLRLIEDRRVQSSWMRERVPAMKIAERNLSSHAKKNCMLKSRNDDPQLVQPMRVQKWAGLVASNQAHPGVVTDKNGTPTF